MQNVLWNLLLYWGIDTYNSFRGLSKFSRQNKLDAYAAVVSEYHVWCLYGNIFHSYEVLSVFMISIFILYLPHGATRREGNFGIISLSFFFQMVLERYFSTSGQDTELVLPRNSELQGKLRRGPPKDLDFFSDEED